VIVSWVEGSMKSVLLVVPSPEVSRLLHDRLHSKGCSVVTAPNLSGARLHIESLGYPGGIHDRVSGLYLFHCLVHYVRSF